MSDGDLSDGDLSDGDLSGWENQESENQESTPAKRTRCLIACLGNPGKKYERTRHNVGFEVAAEIAKRFDSPKPKARFDGELIEVSFGTTPTIVLCPLTYMNVSGKSVRQAIDFFRIPVEDILVVCDDFNLPLGKLRARGQGSAGGQKGLQDILNRLSTNDVPRLRVGIGEPPPRWAIADYVLSRFNNDEQDVMLETYRRAADAVGCWVSDGINACMNRFNGG